MGGNRWIDFVGAAFNFLEGLSGVDLQTGLSPLPQERLEGRSGFSVVGEDDPTARTLRRRWLQFAVSGGTLLRVPLHFVKPFGQVWLVRTPSVAVKFLVGESFDFHHYLPIFIEQ